MEENYGGGVVFGILWCGEMVLFVTVGAMDLSGGIVWKLALVVVPYLLLYCFISHVK